MVTIPLRPPQLEDGKSRGRSRRFCGEDPAPPYANLICGGRPFLLAVAGGRGVESPTADDENCPLDDNCVSVFLWGERGRAGLV